MSGSFYKLARRKFYRTVTLKKTAASSKSPRRPTRELRKRQQRNPEGLVRVREVAGRAHAIAIDVAGRGREVMGDRTGELS